MSADVVYIVTQGQYSDYGIRRAYLDEAEAQAYVDLVNASPDRYDEAMIEEWPLGEDKYFRGTVYNVRITEGEVTGFRREAWSYLEDGQTFIGAAQVETAQVNASGVIYVVVRGTDEGSVEKSAQDAYAAVKAEVAAAGLGGPQ